MNSDYKQRAWESDIHLLSIYDQMLAAFTSENAREMVAKRRADHLQRMRELYSASALKGL